MNICDEYRNKIKITNEMLIEATEEELIALLELVNEDTTSITIQIETAKAELKTSGVYADPEWYQKATAARKIKGQLSQRIQHEITRKKKARKEKNREQYQQDRVKYQEDKVGSLLRAMDQVLTLEQKQQVLDVWRQLLS